MKSSEVDNHLFSLYNRLVQRLDSNINNPLGKFYAASFISGDGLQFRSAKRGSIFNKLILKDYLALQKVNLTSSPVFGTSGLVTPRYIRSFLPNRRRRRW